MKKKAAVISNFDIGNYGNRLQNYAVNEILKKHGYDAAAVIGKLPDLSAVRPMGRKAMLRHLLDSCFRPERYAAAEKQRAYIRRMNRFREFEKNIAHISGDAFLANCSEYAIAAVGSDQVWNPYYVSNMGPLSCANLPDAVLDKTVCMSPSFGVSQLPDGQQAAYRRFLNRIPLLAVREQDGQKLIRELTGRDAQVLPDPTMMLTRREWDCVCAGGKNRKPYILTYILGEKHPDGMAFLKKTAETYGWKIRNLLDPEDYRLYASGPADFIRLIRDAQLVYTDSFHGSCFSILYHKIFVVQDRAGSENMSSRLNTLLSSFGMDHVRLSNLEKSGLPCVDYEAVEEILAQKRRAYAAYLEAAVKEIRQRENRV